MSVVSTKGVGVSPAYAGPTATREPTAEERRFQQERSFMGMSESSIAGNVMMPFFILGALWLLSQAMED